MSYKTIIETVAANGDQPLSYKCENCPAGIEVNEYNGEVTADQTVSPGNVEFDIVVTDGLGREAPPMTIKKKLDATIMDYLREEVDALGITFTDVLLTEGDCSEDFEYKKFDPLNINDRTFELRKVSTSEDAVIWQSIKKADVIDTEEEGLEAGVAYMETDYHNEELCSAGSANPSDPYLAPTCQCVETDVIMKLVDVPEEEAFRLKILFNDGEVFFWDGWLNDPIKILQEEALENLNTIINITDVNPSNPKRVAIKGEASIDWEFCGCECDPPEPCDTCEEAPHTPTPE